MAGERDRVVWNGSRSGPGGGLLLDYGPSDAERRAEHERHERRARAALNPTRRAGPPPWERAGLAKTTYYRRRREQRMASAADVLESLAMLCRSAE